MQIHVYDFLSSYLKCQMLNVISVHSKVELIANSFGYSSVF